MSVSISQLAAYLQNKEDEHLEFKEAKNQFSPEKLIRYCSALSNEGGGIIVLGVSDKIPRRVVGTKAFENTNSIKTRLLVALRMRVEVSELSIGVLHDGVKYTLFFFQCFLCRSVSGVFNKLPPALLLKEGKLMVFYHVDYGSAITLVQAIST